MWDLLKLMQWRLIEERTLAQASCLLTAPLWIVRLYDLLSDPAEMTNLADEPARAALVARFTQELADHLKRTAREPERIPKTDDVHALRFQSISRQYL